MKAVATEGDRVSTKFAADGRCKNWARKEVSVKPKRWEASSAMIFYWIMQ